MHHGLTLLHDMGGPLSSTPTPISCQNEKKKDRAMKHGDPGRCLSVTQLLQSRIVVCIWLSSCKISNFYSLNMDNQLIPPCQSVSYIYGDTTRSASGSISGSYVLMYWN